MRETTVFLWHAMRSRNVCAVVPSSQLTVRKVCSEIPVDRPVNVIEYGPGTGVFTRYLAERLHRDSTILAIELNDGFHQELIRWRDAAKPSVRVILEHGSCADVLSILKRHSLGPADYALSGIPFSVLSERLRMEIVHRTYDALVPGGTFLVYQYSFFMHPRLERVFDHVDTSMSVINLPPTMIMSARKAAGNTNQDQVGRRRKLFHGGKPRGGAFGRNRRRSLRRNPGSSPATLPA